MRIQPLDIDINTLGDLSAWLTHIAVYPHAYHHDFVEDNWTACCAVCGGLDPNATLPQNPEVFLTDTGRVLLEFVNKYLISPETFPFFEGNTNLVILYVITLLGLTVDMTEPYLYDLDAKLTVILERFVEYFDTQRTQ